MRRQSKLHKNLHKFFFVLRKKNVGKKFTWIFCLEFILGCCVYFVCTRSETKTSDNEKQKETKENKRKRKKEKKEWDEKDVLVTFVIAFEVSNERKIRLFCFCFFCQVQKRVQTHNGSPQRKKIIKNEIGKLGYHSNCNALIKGHLRFNQKAYLQTIVVSGFNF